MSQLFNGIRRAGSSAPPRTGTVVAHAVPRPRRATRVGAGRTRPWQVVACAAVLTFALQGAAAAQTDFEAVGTRAQGMGGAFTAVADDSSATWWNPSGILSAGLFDAGLSGGHTSLIPDGPAPIDGAGGWRASPFSAAVTLPVIGVSFHRVDARAVTSAIAAAEPGRQQDEAASIARRLRTNHVAATLAQSLGDFAVVGVTVGAVSGEVSSLPLLNGEPLDDALSRVDDVDGASSTHLDLHAGALVFLGGLRVGIVGRNLARPAFDDPDATLAPIRLERQARVGVAYGGGAPAYQRRPWTVALDADLTRVETPAGPRRELSIGAERWLAGQRIGVRAGTRMQTIGDARPAAAGGVSVAIRSGTYVEAALTGGGARTADGWSVAARVTF